MRHSSIPKWRQCTRQCLRTYTSTFKLYRVCYFRLYKVCPWCGFEFDCYHYHDICPYCGHPNMDIGNNPNGIGNNPNGNIGNNPNTNVSNDPPPQPGFVLFPELLLPTSELALFPELAFYA